MSEIMHLPVEITERVLDHLDAVSLGRTISRVCQQWADISDKILEKRIDKMTQYLSTHSQQLDEIRTHLSPAERDNDQKILEIYETFFLAKGFKIKSVLFVNGRVANFIRSVEAAKKCDCDAHSACVVESLHWMPCHQLILVQLRKTIDFYHMSVLTSDEKEGGRPPVKYNTVLLNSIAKNVEIANNDAAVSVFHDRVVCQKTTRILIIFRVEGVSHDVNKVVLEYIREIFLPFWSCDLILLENKVCILFTTGYVGIWRMKEDDIQLSDNTCVDIETIRKMDSSKMFSVKNLILIKISAEDVDNWSLFDSNDSQPQLQTVHIDNLVARSFLKGWQVCNKVFDVFVTTNAFIVHCEVMMYPDEESRLSRMHKTGRYVKSTIEYPVVSCRRLKNHPTLLDFQSSDKFSLLFDDKAADAKLLPTGSDSASLTSPILSLFVKESDPSCDIISFLGVKDPDPDIKISNAPSSSSKNMLKKAATSSSSRKKISPLSENFGCTLYSLTNRNLQFVSLFK